MLPRQTVEIGGRMLEIEYQVEALQQEYVIRVTPGQPSGADWSLHAIVLRDHRQQVLRHVGRSRTCGVRRHQISLGGEFDRLPAGDRRSASQDRCTRRSGWTTRGRWSRYGETDRPPGGARRLGQTPEGGIQHILDANPEQAWI